VVANGWPKPIHHCLANLSPKKKKIIFPLIGRFSWIPAASQKKAKFSLQKTHWLQTLSMARPLTIWLIDAPPCKTVSKIFLKSLTYFKKKVLAANGLKTESAREI